MEFRYHPLIEGLKINEDGSEILLNGESMKVYKQKRYNRSIVFFGIKSVSTTRLVCEAWHGIAPTGGHAARRINENGSNHYSNLYWGNKGNIETIRDEWNKRRAPITPEIYEEIQLRTKSEGITKVLKDMNITSSTYYRYHQQHVKKD